MPSTLLWPKCYVEVPSVADARAQKLVLAAGNNITLGSSQVGNAVTLTINATGGGAPTGADYLVRTADAGLSAERVVTDTTSITVDWATGGQAKFRREALTGDTTAAQDSNATTTVQARGLRETAGPTTLSMGAVSDGQLLRRVGSTIVGTFILLASVGSQVINEVSSVGTTTDTRAGSVGQVGTLV